jgi:maleate cis-trans isomerase
MFREFVAPALSAQCEWLDFSLFHLDGTQCIGHLDALLEIEALDAIEWTPQAGIEPGGSPRWFEMYRRILNAGKSVQVMASAEDVIPVLEAIGGKGVYIVAPYRDEQHAEEIAAKAASYR